MLSSDSFILATDRALISDFVMGASPLRNSESGMLMGQRVSGLGLKTRAAQRFPRSEPMTSAGVP